MYFSEFAKLWQAGGSVLNWGLAAAAGGELCTLLLPMIQQIPHCTYKYKKYRHKYKSSNIQIQIQFQNIQSMMMKHSHDCTLQIAWLSLNFKL